MTHNVSFDKFQIVERENLDLLESFYIQSGGVKKIPLDILINTCSIDSPGLSYYINRSLLDQLECQLTMGKAYHIINDILNGESFKVPLQSIIDDDIKYIHPGSVRYPIIAEYFGTAAEYTVLVWDKISAFPDYAPLSFTDFKKEFAGLPGYEVIAKKSRNGVYLELWGNSLGDDIKQSHYKKYSQQFSEFYWANRDNVRIYVGYDSQQPFGHDMCVNSIRYYNPTVEIVKLDKKKIQDEYGKILHRDGSTEFTYTRFLTPMLNDYKGIAIYCDDDFLWQCDPLLLLLSINSKDALSVVKHEITQNYSDEKLNGKINQLYDRKLWSSLMVFNCGHADNKKLDLNFVNHHSGEFLHQLKWTECISNIPHRFNWCEEACKYCDAADGDISQAAAIHFTRGGPWLPGNWDHIQEIHRCSGYIRWQKEQ